MTARVESPPPLGVRLGAWALGLFIGTAVGLGPVRAEAPTATPSPAKDSSQDTSSQETSSEEPQPKESWVRPIPVPADPELEDQISEVQEALHTIYTQTVRKKEALREARDDAEKAALSDELERLRKEREDLEAILNDLVEEAKLSEQTAIDAALARARWLERQEERYQKREEQIRDRQP